ncbi:hypothetical protein T4B_4858 [Trichinella pseudospiralis]|uniref:Uncharacterized protein n=1 Tax=Trichinella pseudospiralis TaxID=6337 RepID=A0A0V1J0H6_TRIPS|nr:hypothetical protein T4B_4858 [Trichinella pseudospiralis]
MLSIYFKFNASIFCDPLSFNLFKNSLCNVNLFYYKALPKRTFSSSNLRISVISPVILYPLTELN